MSSLGSFKVCIDRPYSYPLSPAQLMACATDPDQLVVVGAKSSASASTLAVMAVARAADAFMPTYSRTVAHYANGAYWYYLNTTSKSFGFSDVSAVNLKPSDAMCSGYGGNGQGGPGTGPCEGSCENKLSWHVRYGGWRAGCADFLNDNTVWRKVVYILVSGGSYCPLGSYCPSGSESALPCPIGTYCDESGLTATKLCVTGAYCPTTGMSSPRPCPAGSICPDTGMSAPRPCSPGSFCPARGLSNSMPCSAGTYSPTAGELRMPARCMRHARPKYSKSLPAPPRPARAGRAAAATDCGRRRGDRVLPVPAVLGRSIPRPVRGSESGDLLQVRQMLRRVPPCPMQRDIARTLLQVPVVPRGKVPDGMPRRLAG
jgi:hypothetical protein